MGERREVVVKPESLKLKLEILPVALKLRRKSKEEIRNKPIFEEKEYSDNRRASIITKERTEQETKVYHAGKIFKNGKWEIHPKHPKDSKRHKQYE